MNHLSTELLNKHYGTTQQKTDVSGFILKLNESFLFKDGKTRKLVHIEYRNMMIDLLRFDDTKELFTGEIIDNIIFENYIPKSEDCEQK